jgi:VCBS repeat-containing protein
MTTFTISTNSTTGQTLKAAETGTVNATRTLTTTAVAVTWDLSGGSIVAATLTNNGTIQSSGGRALDTNTATTTAAQSLTITNASGASIIGATDVMRIQKSLAGGTFTLDNSGTITAQAGRGFNFQDYAALNLSVTNRSGGIMQSTDDLIRLTRGTVSAFTGTVSIVNSGTMKTTSTTNGQVLDLSDLSSLGTGGSITVTNNAGALMQAANSDALRGAAGTTINNYGTIEAKLASGTTTNNNAIDFKGNAGGTINNYQGGSIIGAHHGITNSVATGQTVAPGIAISNDGTINGLVGSGINLDTASTTTVTISNGVHGLILGHAGTDPTGAASDGDGIDVDGLVNITNSGTIEALGLASGTVTPAGSALPTNEAITVGGGTITNNAGGVIHSVQRAITVDDSNLGNAFAKTTIINNGSITGDNGEAISIHSAFDDVIVNTNIIQGSVSVISVTASSGNASITNSGTIDGAVTTAGGNDTIDNTGLITGAITMGDGNDTLKLGSVHLRDASLGAGSDSILINDGAHAYISRAVTGAESIVLGAGSSLDVSAGVDAATITFGDASVQKLVLDWTTLLTGDFANRLVGLGVGDSIGLTNIGLATSATIGAGNVLTLAGGSQTITLHLDPTQDFSAQRFHLSSDGAGGTLVTLADNSAPVSADSSASGDEDHVLTGTVVASDADNDSLTYTLVTGPSHGTLTFNTDGSWSYAPAQDYNGADSFTWTASDGTVSTATAGTVSLSLAAVNDAPALTGAQAVLAHASEDTVYTVTKAQLLQGFSDVDGDTLSVGTLSVNHGTALENADGSWTVTLDADYNGALALDYTVVDGNGGSIAASLAATIAAVNDAPRLTGTHIGVDGSAGVEDTPLILTTAFLASGYTDTEGDSLSITDLVADQGTVTDNHDGTFTLTPPANFTNLIGLSYNIVDGNGGVVAQGTSVGFVPVNDAPSAIALSNASVAEGSANGALVGTFTATDVDDSLGFQWQLLDNAGGRFAIDAATGALTVANGSALDFETQASWTLDVQVTDPQGASFHRSVTIGLTDVVEPVFTGTKKADTFTAPDNRSWIVNGLAGNDTLTTGSGGDRITGGAGNDTIKAGGGDDVILVGLKEGVDSVDGGAGFDVVRATADNVVIGLSALAGVEQIDAGAHAGVTVLFGKTDDTFDFGGIALTGIVSVDGGKGNDSLTGTAGADKLLGGAGDDSLLGADGADVLIGGAGVDRLTGGAGADVLTGGTGKDVFVFTALAESSAGTGIDHIVDFKTKGDTIDLSAIDANNNVAGDQAFAFIGTAAFGGIAGQLRVGTDAGKVALFADVNGDKVTDFEILFDSAAKFAATDFVL